MMRRCTYEPKNALQSPPSGAIEAEYPSPLLLFHASMRNPLPTPIGGFRAHDAIILIIYTL